MKKEDTRPKYEPPRARDISEPIGPVRGVGGCRPGSDYMPYCAVGIAGPPPPGATTCTNGTEFTQ